MASKLHGAGDKFSVSAIRTGRLSAATPLWQMAPPARVGRLGTVLVANDDKDEASLLSYALKAASVKNPIRWLNDANEVMYFLNHGGTCAVERPPIPEMPLMLFLDWDIPWHGAIDLLKWIRQRPKFLHLLVVVMTRSDDPEQRQLAYETGATWHFVKSADFADLMRLVRRLREFWSYAVEPGFYEQLAARL